MGNTPEIFADKPVDVFLSSLQGSRDLNKTLIDMVHYIENRSAIPVQASILLLDESGKRLFRGAAPSLPESYSSKIDGLEIGPNVGSCGTAVYCGHSIYACDIGRDELWAAFKDLAAEHGLRACWSVPIIASNSQIYGTFALYYKEIKNPTLDERRFIEDCARSIGQFIEKAREMRLSA
jgi:GAF domain-containing protein